MGAAGDKALAFRRFEKPDIPLLLPLEQEAYPDPWTHGMFRQELTNGSSHFYVGLLDGQVVAYGGFWLVLDEAHVTKVTVAAPFRGRGYGRALMNFLLEESLRLEAATVRLEVRESNASAQALYLDLGFEISGVRKNYYTRSQEDAVVMVLDLVGP